MEVKLLIASHTEVYKRHRLQALLANPEMKKKNNIRLWYIELSLITLLHSVLLVYRNL
ncbi:hypothetical protein [Cytobacillus sp. IB215665]|uniref:hypothetical protein n=1 Tax=Cytobacillus sp. IB215665 TaxID=3097357 RepID=UPI002A0CC0C3|nr:hypothetical protein [Cytobacillus sp. IB215665]MDX8365438.1 hypothetical protein [Cytobacillus sp. IB215665]